MSFCNRYRWLAPLALFSIGTLAARMLYTGTPRFGFLLWNLLLAAVPLGVGHRMRAARAPAAGWLWAGLWLLFFPNALYITTDLFHLRERPEAPLWLDLLVLLSAAVNGALWGLLSLRDAEAWLARRLPARWVRVIVFGLLLACGFGIYLGRYLRYNSWDALVQPAGLAIDIGTMIRHPFRHADAWALSVGFGIWGLLLYGMLRRASARGLPDSRTGT